MEQIIYLDENRKITTKVKATIKVIRELDKKGRLLKERWDFLKVPGNTE